MKLDEALEFIHSVSWMGSRPGLDRTRALLNLLGDPQERYNVIHIAGTNGKGSTAAMLASILSQAGFRTGLYTSPYLFHFGERMQVDGKPIPGGELAEITRYVRPLALSMDDSPTEFELITCIALEYFAQRDCDVAVLEVGMGGRLDATNVIRSPECSVITSIGLDHTRELGETIELIARQKAGIIKAGCDTVLYDQQQSVKDVISAVCLDLNAPLHLADFEQIRPVSDSVDGQVFHYKDYTNLRLPLLGAHQLKNAAVALETISVLRGKGWHVPGSAVAGGLAKTVWPARFEVVSRKPLFVVDGGHNPQGAQTVVDNIKSYFPGRKAVFLLGVMGDKDYPALTGILDQAAQAYVAVAPDSPRALPPSELARHLEGYGRPVQACGSVGQGVSAAVSLAGPGGLVCAAGSLYLAGAVRACFNLY